MAREKSRHTKPPGELYVRKLTVDEALLKLDSYLNNAVTAGLTQFTIVHGKGQGILRSAIQAELTGSPLVRSYRDGLYGEGESGVTVVYLA
jgi:DNA mismatch repair protein MutS2